MSKTGPISFGELYQRLERAERQLRPEEGEAEEERARILEERAEHLAQVRAARDEARVELLAFKILDERFAIALSQVEEILDVAGLYPLPGVRPHIAGVVMSRLRIIPVLDPRALMRVGTRMSDLKIILVLQARTGPFGIVVQEVQGLLELAPGALAGGGGGAVIHITDDGRSVLEADGIAQLDALAGAAGGA